MSKRWRADMLRQVENWAAVNTGSRNLDGLAILAARLAGAFADLPGEIRLVDATPVDAIDASGKSHAVAHGRNLHLTVRPDAPLQLLFTGHMDTVFGADHPFQHMRWIEQGRAGWPRGRRHEGRDRGDARGAEGGRGVAAGERRSAMR